MKYSVFILTASDFIVLTNFLSNERINYGTLTVIVKDKIVNEEEEEELNKILRTYGSISIVKINGETYKLIDSSAKLDERIKELEESKDIKESSLLCVVVERDNGADQFLPHYTSGRLVEAFKKLNISTYINNKILN